MRIIPVDAEFSVYYTLDGSVPTSRSAHYTGPVKTGDGIVHVRSITYDAHSKKYSAVTEENFDISRKDWKIIGATDSSCYNILDGDPGTQWYQDKTHTMPVDLIIDLGKENTISGFKYLPDQHWWGSGIIINYIFYVSVDGKEWKQTDKGEFSNIKNNPVWQIKNFPQVKAVIFSYRHCKIRKTIIGWDMQR